MIGSTSSIYSQNNEMYSSNLAQSKAVQIFAGIYMMKFVNALSKCGGTYRNISDSLLELYDTPLSR
jgi:hypothetical protein